jgi:hypothetical protein
MDGVDTEIRLPSLPTPVKQQGVVVIHSLTGIEPLESGYRFQLHEQVALGGDIFAWHI